MVLCVKCLVFVCYGVVVVYVKFGDFVVEFDFELVVWIVCGLNVVG